MTGPLSPAGGNTDAPRRPPLIFLEKYARTGTGDAMNAATAATARSRSSDGDILEISLWFHQPPALSYFCARGHYGSDERLHVVGAEGRLALLRASFATLYGYESYEYFLYKSGFGEPASLDAIPPCHFPRNVKELAVVPRGHGGHEYLLAALAIALDLPDYTYNKLYIYSSEDKSWTSILLQNPIPQLRKTIRTSKVVNLGEGLVAWVDYHHGMLVFDLHETNPTARYIPLPDPLPGNRDQMQELAGRTCTGRYQDLACINGVLKFIEMEHHVVIKTQEPSFPPENGKVLDSDLIMSRQREKPKPVKTWNGWTAVMWSRTVSPDGWEMGPVLDAADFVLDNPMDLLSMLSGLKDRADIGKMEFKDLYSDSPILSTDGDDILYLHSSTRMGDWDRRVVALDLRTNRVKVMGDFSPVKRWHLVKAFGPCPVPHVITGYWLRKSTMDTMELRISCKMITFLRSVRLKTIRSS
ncbi:unnamed protein product [Urochloa decumbens]|uniref:DUF1618 domain-containing protein n=1 Tax=Urochloa decumbens TaxID=240449 RepID=A0ABC8XN78_9POAL